MYESIYSTKEGEYGSPKKYSSTTELDPENDFSPKGCYFNKPENTDWRISQSEKHQQHMCQLFSRIYRIDKQAGRHNVVCIWEFQSNTWMSRGM